MAIYLKSIIFDVIKFSEAFLFCIALIYKKYIHSGLEIKILLELIFINRIRSIIIDSENTQHRIVRF
jgi:hypothetical protein